MAILDEISMETGVPRSTVARILSRQEPETRPTAAGRARHVREVAQRLGHRPNTAAQAVSRGRFNSVAILTIEGSTWLPYWFLPTLEEEVGALNMHLLFTMLSNSLLSDEKRIPKLLREQGTDGFIVHALYGYPPELMQLFDRYEIPAIWYNTKRETDCAYPDDFQGAVTATRHLLDMGHVRIAYYGNVDYLHYSSVDREAGYKETMASVGLTPQIVQPQLVDEHRTDFWSTWRSLLASSNRPTAVITVSEQSAIALAQVAAEMRLRIPEDISVISFTELGPLPLEKILTAMLMPTANTARVALGMLLNRINNPGFHLPAALIPFELRDGETCAPPRKQP